MPPHVDNYFMQGTHDILLNVSKYTPMSGIPLDPLQSVPLSVDQGPLLLTWFNFNPSMDK